ncbi:MAG: hypothetical protein M3081_15040 [Gemmatimonadota bacterium]|nr:hypothetical protein [Gemmatimonadota bacterium]
MNNLNNPDINRALASPAAVEQLIGNAYNTVHSGTIGGQNDGLQPEMLVMSFESYSGLANFDMGPRAGVPRGPVNNSRGNSGQVGKYYDFRILSRAARTAALGLAQFAKPGFTTGSATQDGRDRAFGFFVLGTALGNMALAYDSGAVVSPLDPNTDPPFIPDLVGYNALMTYSLQQLDSAIALANANTGGFPTLAAWLGAGTGQALSAADFVKLCRTYKARFRAMVGRTKAERDAADWNAIIADANAGITADFAIPLNPNSGWDNVWVAQHYSFDTWHQQPTPIIGMADSSGGYNAWLATPLATRSAFLIQTADKRFPSGTTRPAQNTASNAPGSSVIQPWLKAPYNGPTASASDSAATPTYSFFPYFRNRTAGLDRVGEAWANSQYDHYRFQALRTASRIGLFPVITKAENDMLAAEGYIRTNQIPLAIAKIDPWRARAGLPKLAGVITARGQPVPGGTFAAPSAPSLTNPSCVPRIPVAPFNVAQCGDIFEAMKWEKRMETAFTGYGQWFFDGRGWNDLIEGTPTQFPVPFQEMDSRTHPFYNLGGVGGTSAAPKGTYGFF